MSRRAHVAARMEGIAPFHVMELLARAQQLEAEGRDIIHMEIGEPDFPTPEPIVAAGREALAAGRTRYTPALGIPALRDAIAGHYRDYYGVAVPAERIVVTPGASGALQLALGVLVDTGDEVLMTDPGYPCNRHFVHLFGGVPRTVPVGPEERYQLAPDTVAAAWRPRTRAVMVASPANPTGTLIDPPAMRALHDEVTARGGTLIVDEIYHGLVYGERERTAAALSDDVVVINSFSKFFGMTGWRLGWLVVPPGLLRAVERLAQNIFLAPSTPSQYAALAAFSAETMAILEDRRNEFAARRECLLPALREIGFGVPVAPAGAFYVYADSSPFADDSEEFARRLLDHAGVAATPGVDFGVHRAAGHIRFAYTTSIERLGEAAERIARVVS